MDIGVQGFDAPIQHFWALSNFLNWCYIDIGVAESRSRAPTGHDVPAKFS